VTPTRGTGEVVEEGRWRRRDGGVEGRGKENNF